jgi:hypothetical protein
MRGAFNRIELPHVAMMVSPPMREGDEPYCECFTTPPGMID